MHLTFDNGLRVNPQATREQIKQIRLKVFKVPASYVAIQVAMQIRLDRLEAFSVPASYMAIQVDIFFECVWPHYRHYFRLWHGVSHTVRHTECHFWDHVPCSR